MEDRGLMINDLQIKNINHLTAISVHARMQKYMQLGCNVIGRLFTL
jgi:hypothetical protein